MLAIQIGRLLGKLFKVHWKGYWMHEVELREAPSLVFQMVELREAPLL